MIKQKKKTNLKNKGLTRLQEQDAEGKQGVKKSRKSKVVLWEKTLISPDEWLYMIRQNYAALE